MLILGFSKMGFTAPTYHRCSLLLVRISTNLEKRYWYYYIQFSNHSTRRLYPAHYDHIIKIQRT